MVAYEVAHSLTTSISCCARLMMSAANVIPNASGGSRVQRQGVGHSVVMVIFRTHFVNGLVHVECTEEATHDKFEIM